MGNGLNISKAYIYNQTRAREGRERQFFLYGENKTKIGEVENTSTGAGNYAKRPVGFNWP